MSKIAKRAIYVLLAITIIFYLAAISDTTTWVGTKPTDVATFHFLYFD